MGFFKKSEKEKIPGLPPLPNLPSIQDSSGYEQQIRSFSLPSFPNSNFGERLNQDTIKDAVIDDESNDKFDNLIKPKVIEQDYSHKAVTMEIPEWPQNQVQRQSFKAKKTEPLFIKLERFESTITAFNEIKQKVSEIESLLKNVRDIKSREEKELNEWEREIETLKAKLDQIDQELFKAI